VNHKIYTRALASTNSSNDGDVFRNVSVITIGEAKGHACFVDKTCLQQILNCARKFPKGVKAQLNHFSGIESVFGVINNFHIEGDRLLGDLTLFPEHPDYLLTKRQIQTLSDSLGFSVFFSGDDENIGGTCFCRCQELHSIDFVTNAAANPGGIFSRGTRTESRSNNATNFMNYTVTPYHLSYRKFRNQGLGKQAALKASQKADWDSYVAFCRLQDSGTVMESLDEPNHERNLSIIRTGRLM